MIVAIGGGASVGTTTLAAALSTSLGIDRVVHVDDVALAAGITLRVDRPGFWRRPVDALLADLRMHTEQLHPLIAHAIASCSDDAVVEGEGIEPALVANLGPDVRSLYVVEDSPDRLRATFLARPSRDRFLALDPDERGAVVAMNVAYGTWLASEAERFRYRWVRSAPHETLEERARAGLGW